MAATAQQEPARGKRSVANGAGQRPPLRAVAPALRTNPIAPAAVQADGSEEVKSGFSKVLSLLVSGLTVNHYVDQTSRAKNLERYVEQLEGERDQQLQDKEASIAKLRESAVKKVKAQQQQIEAMEQDRQTVSAEMAKQKAVNQELGQKAEKSAKAEATARQQAEQAQAEVWRLTGVLKQRESDVAERQKQQQRQDDEGKQLQQRVNMLEGQVAQQQAKAEKQAHQHQAEVQRLTGLLEALQAELAEQSAQKQRQQDEDKQREQPVVAPEGQAANEQMKIKQQAEQYEAEIQQLTGLLKGRQAELDLADQCRQEQDGVRCKQLWQRVEALEGLVAQKHDKAQQELVATHKQMAHWRRKFSEQEQSHWQEVSDLEERLLTATLRAQELEGRLFDLECQGASSARQVQEE